MTVIHTWGYQGNTPLDLQRYQRLTGSRVVDVRISRHTPKRDWQAKALLALLGSSHYIAVPEFGNVNYRQRSKGIQLLKPETGVALIVPTLDAGRSVILLCACAGYERCHRTVVAELLASYRPACPITHLPGSVDEWQHQLVAARDGT